MIGPVAAADETKQANSTDKIKSISVGPLRFNLSKSGIGVFAGVTGLRFGVGPRGNYVHMGRGGLYFRATLPPSSSLRNSPAQPLSPISPEIPPGTHAPLEEIERTTLRQDKHRNRCDRRWPSNAALLPGSSPCLRSKRHRCRWLSGLTP